ncbi:MAG: carboxypeptidase regulatory-like domain-containing protein, partial [bacterium]
MKKLITFLDLSKGIMVVLMVLMSGVILAQNVPEWMYFKFNVAGNQPNAASAPVGTNPATLTGMTTGGTGQFGTALVGNGLTSTSNNLNTGWATSLPNTGWTISFWLNNFPATSATTFYYFGDASAASFRCFTGGVAPAGGLLLRGTGLTDVPINAIPSTPTVIHLVYTGSSVKVFKNGVLDNTVAQPAIAFSGAGPFLVGGYSSSNCINAGTLMDEFRLYNRALTDVEVLSTWNIGLPAGATGGTLSGTVTNATTTAPLAGATIAVGALNTTSAANGTYSIPNVPVGAQTATCTATGFQGQSQTVTMVLSTTTTQNFALIPITPQMVSGTVTDASTGAPLVGATVTVGTGANAVTTLTIAGGTYLTPQILVSGAQPIVIGKTGYDDFTGTVTLIVNTTVTQNAALLPTAVQPGPFTAALNNPTTPTAVNLNWGIPQGMYQIIYDDGTQDNFAIWATANNLNALKFTPLSWPVKLVGGKLNLGTSANYPANALPLTKFKMLAYKADGAGGVPGTIIDSVEVTPTGFGWADFSFASPITITSGDFYLVMKQGGIPPHAAGVGVDLTNTQLRSYSKFVTGGAPWIPAAGNFMIRAIMQGTGGPILGDNSASKKEPITAGVPEGLIYEKPVATVTGYEGVADYMPLTMSYQVWRLQQGQEGNQALWTSIWTGSVNTTVDNSWPTLPNGPYRWAVKAIYSPPGQR